MTNRQGQGLQAARGGSRSASGSTAHSVPDGFSLVEVVVAMTIFAIVMAALGGLLFKVSLQGTVSVAKAERMAAFTEYVNQLSTVPFDSLPGRSGCTQTGEPPNARTECITVVNMSAKVARVTIVITPANAAFKPDTVRIDRGRPPAGNPLNTP